MIRATLISVAMASPAMALTPIPTCSNAPFGDYVVLDAWHRENEFVSYYAIKPEPPDAVVVLEHCGTGQAVIAYGKDNDRDDDPDHLNQVFDAMEFYTFSDRSFTLPAITRGLKGKGIKARQIRFKDESCACHAYYPELRGNRSAYTN